MFMFSGKISISSKDQSVQNISALKCTLPVTKLITILSEYVCWKSTSFLFYLWITEMSQSQFGNLPA